MARTERLTRSVSSFDLYQRTQLKEARLSVAELQALHRGDPHVRWQVFFDRATHIVADRFANRKPELRVVRLPEMKDHPAPLDHIEEPQRRAALARAVALGRVIQGEATPIDLKLEAEVNGFMLSGYRLLRGEELEAWNRALDPGLSLLLDTEAPGPLVIWTG